MDHSILTHSVDQLADINTLSRLFDKDTRVFRMPSEHVLKEVIDITRDIIFPYHYGETPVYADTLKYYIGVRVDRLSRLLREQIAISLEYDEDYCAHCQQRADEITSQFIASLPSLRAILTTDVVAAYNGDPAAKNNGEIIACYPTVKVLTNYRVAHQLLLLGVPLIPRILTEMAHSETGIDIHPGATIGESFTIDHGTGVVIGETCIIGKNVKLYQGVTLGALSTSGGQSLYGTKRHPTIEDYVTIYSGASILGGETVIGSHSVVGSNAFITKSIPEGTRVSIKNQELQFKGKDGSIIELSDTAQGEAWFYTI